MNRYLTSSLTAFLMAFVLQPHKANAQETSSAKTPAPPVTYFLSNPYDSAHHKMTLSIPADYFIDGAPPTSGSTVPAFLLNVSWPSWIGDPDGNDRGALRILAGSIQPNDSDNSVNHDYFMGAVTVKSWEIPKDRKPMPPQFIPVQKNPLPTPTGHGIQEVIRDKAVDIYLNEDLYVLMDANNIPIVWLACNKDGVVPQCEENFTFHRLQTTISYPRSRVGSWFEIMTDVKQKILTFIKQP
ncbi:hypothetical protein [Swingsia samuiensis]|uniref:Uncharacterized protein n=1 Tax=Swingsia samuiensis TaxID=1293412 RepID=A0A4Y6UI37_9PROT|nr:hypothetical protein [Swingsia samuiensis]QDH17233.1 hypothetical protein E3D00_06420 [Swingsia samuiensis]